MVLTTAPALRALMRGLIDYAGLFPPAELPMEGATSRYLHERGGAEAWMLGRFVCPLGRLDEAAAAFGEVEIPVEVSALLPPGASTEEIASAVGRAMERAESSSILRIRALEGRVAGEIEGSWCEDLARRIGRATRDAIGRAAPLFLEFSPESSADVHEWGAVCASAGTGLKLRSGGNTVPPVELVAEVLRVTRARDVPFKATAGLHHPLARPAESGEPFRHGFINLFVAGILDRLHGLDADTVQRVLREDRSNAFVFDSSGLEWGRLRAGVDPVRALRVSALTSFGSCSFDEPRDDLRALGWLP